MMPIFSRKALMVMLVASLGINMLVGGFILRQELTHRGPPSVDSFIERMASNLSAADADILRRTFQENREALAVHDQWRAGFHERIGAALTAEPFDPAKLSEVFGEMDRHDTDMHRLMQHSLIKAASEMSPQGRQQMAKFRP